jgi:hypothetical protein
MPHPSLQAPPDRVPSKPPVESLHAELPFGELSWENFERLCYRLVRGHPAVEAAYRYGRAGQAQQGIDIVVRLAEGGYEVWQAKRYTRFGKHDLARALKTFDAGNWKTRSQRLTIAVQASLADVELQEAIEAAVQQLRGEGVALEVLGGEELSNRLRAHPDLVHDFFGRDWTRVFLGEAETAGQRSRLDGAEFAKLREQLARTYQTQFGIVDQGVIAPVAFPGAADAGLPLLERYVQPDVVIRERRASPSPPSTGSGAMPRERTAGAGPAGGTSPVEQLRRIPLETWSREGERLALVGDAGLGKSTFLRCLALDLLGDQNVFPRMAERWGLRLPLVVPFAKWARLAAAQGGPVGLKDVLRALWQPLLTADLVGLIDRAVEEGRVLLLIDGLDEWSSEHAAAVALTALLTQVGTFAIPVVVTGRPRGLQRIAQLDQTWRFGELAPLSPAQQRALAAPWFSRRIALQTARDPQSAAVTVEIDRFFRDLQREAGLRDLSETPLLLLGLVALYLRGHALPRNRAQALEKLVETLLEEHPLSRAKAAGETEPRVEVLADFDLLRGVLAAVALASRLEGGDAGFDRERVRAIALQYLRDEAGLSLERARAGCAELLSVNSETVGLIIEKAPDELGFAHASLEEYLAAQALLRRPLEDLLSFAREHAGDPRWRNVLADLAAQMSRPNEIVALVTVVEESAEDPIAASNRFRLRAAIAFGAPRIPAATGRRIADETFVRIEGAGWANERADLLRSAQRGLGHPNLGPVVAERMSIWAPQRENFLTPFFTQLADWPVADDVFDALCRGLVAEDSHNAFAAVRALVKSYKDHPALKPRLRGLIDGGSDDAACATALATLVLADPHDPWTIARAEEARTSVSPALCIMGILARVKRGGHGAEDKTDLIEILSDYLFLGRNDGGLAFEALIEGWPRDTELVDLSLRAARDHDRGALGREVAYGYLLRGDPADQRIRDWNLGELDQRFPFSGTGEHNWVTVYPFAQADPAVFAKLVDVLLRPEQEAMRYQVWELIALLHDPRLKARLIDQVRTGTSMEPYWSLKPLLEGWRGDPEVEALIAEVAAWPDERLAEILSLLPQIIPDPEACRARLLSFKHDTLRLRYDMLARALMAVGCDGADLAAVGFLLMAKGPVGGIQNPSRELVQGFSAHPEVRDLALRLMDGPSPPLDALARGFADDPVLRARILAVAGALPTSLRYVLVDGARIEGDRHPAWAGLLAAYDCEEDSDLKVSLAIGRYEHLVASDQVDDLVVERLVSDCHVLGSSYEARRAAAFAGLTVIGRLDRFVAETERDGHLKISFGSYGSSSTALAELVASRWPDLKAAMGETFFERVGVFSTKPVQTWEEMAPYLSAGGAAEAEFSGFCESTVETLGLSSLRALVRARPGSALLEAHCLRALEVPGPRSDLDAHLAAVEAARILHDQFPGRPDLEARIMGDWVADRLSNRKVLALSIYAPQSPALTVIPLGDEDLERTRLNWPAVIQVASLAKSTDLFVNLTGRMLHRGTTSPWHLQSAMTEVVAARLARDEAATTRLARALHASDATPTTVASVPRLLAAAGRLTPEIRAFCLAQLTAEVRTEAVPRVGFDAVADANRAVSHSLFDTLAQDQGL